MTLVIYSLNLHGFHGVCKIPVVWFSEPFVYIFDCFLVRLSIQRLRSQNKKGLVVECKKVQMHPKFCVRSL